MRIKFYFHALFLTFIFFCSQAQENKSDSSRTLNEVIVKAYASGRPQQEVPAAIGLIGERELNRVSNTSLLPAVNMIPGVRMEERSPGSYRFAIRGSSLRSPFGVRNVKFYWNGLPLTDGSGNTYLNLLDFSSVGNMEIIKGPGGSLYGAGTGGVVLLNSPSNSDMTYSILGGSYGLFRVQGGGNLISTEKFQMNMRIGYQQSDGYRKQTSMNRFVAQLDWKNVLSAKSILSGTIFSTQLKYGTPGGLNKAQYDADPQQARPAAGAFGSAESQQASINNKTTYAGLSFEHEWSDDWSTRIGMFGSVTDFINPAIRNYEIRREENWGGRTDTQYKFVAGAIKGKITFGAEYQHFYSTLTDYDNNQGVQGKVQTDDVLHSTILIGFAQAEFDLPHNFFFTFGGSQNYIQYQFLRKSTDPAVSQERNFNPVFSPRVALLKKISTDLSVYGSISNGFSPPSLAEVRPSTGNFNNNLNAENGTSYEAGIKGRLLNLLDATLAVYDFELNETIVNQPDISGADYFVNAGATSQKGVELALSWSKLYAEKKMSSVRFWSSYTYADYKFKDYIYIGKDYSGNAVTGVAPNTVVLGADLRWRKGFYVNVTGSYTDRIPLNYATMAYASEYFLLGTRIGYSLNSKVPLDFFIGIDNALDQKYSLGNDLNDPNGRYYNAAAPRNYYAGIVARIPKPK